jgi:hypothetical protein
MAVELARDCRHLHHLDCRNALVGYLPVENALAELLQALGTVAPEELVQLLQRQLERIARGSEAAS